MSSVPGMPVVASAHGPQVDLFILILHGIMVAAFLGWGTWFAVSIVRFRAGKNPRADYRGLRSKWPYVFVALMAVGEFTLLLGMALPYWHKAVNAAPAPGDDVVVLRVVAQQFQWNIHYPGADGVFGRTDPALVDDQLNQLGLDKNDPYSADDIATLNQMHLPVDRQVVIQLSSKDMVHSFYLPEFRVKQDVIPGMRIPVYFRPTMTTAELREIVGNPGRNFEIACAQLCGVNHYTMRGFVTVETIEAFDRWYAAKLEEKQAYQDDDDWF